jgi:oligopeptide transport system substrate-binding protein
MLGLLALVAFAAITACGDDDDDATNTPAPTGTGAATATTSTDDAAPTDQQNLVIQSLEPQFYDPHRSNFEQDISVQRHVWRGLYRLVSTEDGSAEPVADYADGDPVPSADGKTFTVKIKAGHNWSDGVPITAQHFADGVKEGCNPNNASPYVYLLQTTAIGGIVGVAGCDEYSTALGTAEAPLTPTEAELQTLADGVGVNVVDDTTLEVTVVDAVSIGTFKNIFSLWTAFPSRLDVIEEHGDRWTDPENVVANGPFTISELVPGDHVTLVPNPEYDVGEPTKLQSLRLQFIDDYSAASRDFQNGELDMTRITDTDVPVFQEDPDLAEQLLVYGSARITTLQTQLENETLANDDVRLAFSKAIDRDALVEVTTSNVGQKALFWMVKGIPGHQGNEHFAEIDFDPEAAKQHLADAGFPDGAGFPVLNLTIQDSPNRVAQADFLKNAFKQHLNIDIEITTVDSRTRSQIFNAETFELFIGGWQLDYPDPENPIVGLFNTDGGNNHYNCSDPAIDAKIEEGSTATDFEDHVRAFQEAEDLIVTGLCGVIPFMQEGLPFLIDPKVGGVQENGTIDAGGPGTWCGECWYVKNETS